MRELVVKRVTRDVFVSTVATALFAYEVVFGGGRPAVLTACVSLLLSPVIMRVDEARRTTKDETDAAE